MLRTITSVLFVFVLMSHTLAARAELADSVLRLEWEVKQACPEQWEEIRGYIDHLEGRIIYTPDPDSPNTLQDIWGGKLIDRGQYTRYGLRFLHDENGNPILSYQEPTGIIYVCALVRDTYFSVIQETHRSDNGYPHGRQEIIAKLTDDDDDGVFNYWDTHEDCQATPPELERPENDAVFTFIDLDNDGEHDDPTRPAGCAESELDYDGDGVSNLIDQCKDSPQSAIDNNLIHTDGCTDSDQDNQSDPNDPYPFQDDTQCTP